MLLTPVMILVIICELYSTDSVRILRVLGLLVSRLFVVALVEFFHFELFYWTK